MMPASGFTFHAKVAMTMNAASVWAVKCSWVFRRSWSGSRPMTPGWAIVVTKAPSPTMM